MNTKTETAEIKKPDVDTVTIEIDGKPLAAKKGMMVIQVADAAGIYIPRFCYHKNLSIAANCRMCLVEVEKAPKPLPACATPVADGMKIFTQSAQTKTAQRGVMEFLLINHPLDCPICDQGGECELQDLSVGYGADLSRFQEKKRIIKDKNLGALISTDMTRCIYCTRCVRFGQEVAGIKELGMSGRGEHARIGTFIEQSVDSEVSGNVIDLCPVGALTSKPYRYSARPWELVDHESISPHDCVGTNLIVQTRAQRVMRVLPKENPELNSTWLADRDRFSYEACNSSTRLLSPRIRLNGAWQQTDWQTALSFAANGLRQAVATYGASQLGALAAPHSTLEEFYLFQKLARGLGSGNIDHRLRQIDFSNDENTPVFPGLGISIPELEDLDSVLLIGSNIRKQQPLLAVRLRKAQRQGTTVMAINPVDYDFTDALDHKIIASPSNMVIALAGVAKALSEIKGAALDSEASQLLSSVSPTETEKSIASALSEKNKSVLLLGDSALNHPRYSLLRLLAEIIADQCGTQVGVLTPANSVGGYLAGCLPHRVALGQETDIKGSDAYSMVKEPLKTYITMNIDPELDCLDGGRTRAALGEAEFFVAITPFDPESVSEFTHEHADVILPMTPFTETPGTFINCEGRAQSFNAAVQPLGEARPAWKILRVLANQLQLAGFDFETIEDVRAEINYTTTADNGKLSKKQYPKQLTGKSIELVRIVETPIYRSDNLVRQASALQQTSDNPPIVARMNAAELKKAGLHINDRIRIRMLEGDAHLEVVADERVPDGCILIPSAYPASSELGAYGAVTVSQSK